MPHPHSTLPHAPLLLSQPQESPEWEEAVVTLDEKKAEDFRRLDVEQAVRAEKGRVLQATPHIRVTLRVWVRVKSLISEEEILG